MESEQKQQDSEFWLHLFFDVILRFDESFKLEFLEIAIEMKQKFYPF